MRDEVFPYTARCPLSLPSLKLFISCKMQKAEARLDMGNGCKEDNPGKYWRGEKGSGPVPNVVGDL